MDMIPLLCILSVAFTGLTKGAGVLQENTLDVTVGETVTFTTTLPPPEHPFRTAEWKVDGREIFFFNGLNNTAPEYTGRITIMSNGSLELRNVAVNDSGEYTVTITPFGESEKTGNTTLNVYVPVSNVIVTASSTDLVEFNSSVRLSCSSSGSSLSFLWLNRSSEVTASDKVQLTDGGANLTIVNVTRYDQGPFRCHVFNPVSNGTSDPFNLSISYGPDNIHVIISPLQKYYVEGSNISLMSSAVSKPSAQFYWFLNGRMLSDTGSELNLTNVQMSDSGNYSCQAFNQKTLRYETSQPSAVSVLARVANVVVTSNSTDLVEFNSSVHLFCSSSGSFLSFLWLNGSSEVTASDKVQLTDGNSTLTIVNVTRYDQGPFRCRVFNPFSNGTSDPFNLSISYGPENIHITISPSQKYYVEGSNISLMCSAVSKPSAQFYWFLNGRKLSDTGSELRLMNVQMSHSGNYSCQAFNNKTLRYDTSQQPSVVSVLERISGASLTSSTNVTIEGNPVNLTCDAAGSVFTREWKKDGSNLSLADNIILYNESRVLSFHPLKKTDSGEYSCIISNPVSSEGATYKLVVNYGPENIHIKGPSQITVGEKFTLTCFADSTPSASYIWMLNKTEIHNSSVFTKEHIEPSDSGNYTCQAMNEVTGKTSSAVHTLSVTAIPESKPSPCPPGCIAGIVIACLVVCGAAAGGGYYFYRKKKYTNKSSTRNTTTRTGGEGQDNLAFSESQEPNYADVRFVQNKDGAKVHLGSQNETSEYSEVRVNNNPPAASSPPSYDAHLQRMKRQAPQPDANGTQDYAQVRKT